LIGEACGSFAKRLHEGFADATVMVEYVVAWHGFRALE
jgi:hypothetical protein